MKRVASAHAYYANGVVLELQNRNSKALDEFIKAVRLTPEDEEMAWDVARKLIAAKKPEAAVELLKQSADEPHASGVTWARLAAVELQTGDTDAAVKASREAIRRAPEILQGHQTLFLARLQAGNLDEARKVLEAAQTEGKGNAEFLIQLSELFGLLAVQEPGKRSELQARRLAILEEVASLPIDSDGLRLRLADGFFDLGQNDRAAEIYQELLETTPDSPGMRDVIRSKLTQAYLKGGDSSRTREQLEKLVKRDPTNVQASYLLGTLAYQARDYEAARDAFKRVTLLQPDFEPAYYDLAEVLLNLDKPDEADEVIAEARHKFPQNFSMEVLSAMVDLRRNQPALALPHFTTAEIMAQAMDPERLTYFFYFQYAVATEQAGDTNAAEMHLKKCLELNPDFTPAQNYLGYMWAEQGQHLDEALELIEKAVAAEPENAAYLDSLGWVLYKLNRPKDALDALLKAVSYLEEPDPIVYDHLGDVYDALQQSNEAIKAWVESYGLSPTNSVREKLEQAGHPVPVQDKSDEE